VTAHPEPTLTAATNSTVRTGEPLLASLASWAVLAASFGLSASTWIALAVLAGFTAHLSVPGVLTLRLAWLMPVAVDGYVVVALVLWMAPVPARVASFARKNTYLAATIGIAAQSAYHLLFTLSTTTELWRVVLAAVVGALPPAVAALAVHMRALIRRESTTGTVTTAPSVTVQPQPSTVETTTVHIEPVNPAAPIAATVVEPAEQVDATAPTPAPAPVPTPAQVAPRITPPRPAPAASAPVSRRTVRPHPARPNKPATAATTLAPSTTDHHVTESDAAQLALPVAPDLLAEAGRVAARYRHEHGTPITAGQLAVRLKVTSDQATQALALLDINPNTPTGSTTAVNGNRPQGDNPVTVSTLTVVPEASASGTAPAAEPTRTRIRRPRLLDLFCGAGGASAGYHAAGFDVFGVDLAEQPDYPFPFLRVDALTVDLTGFDIVHASPPCQRWCTATPPHRRVDHPDLLAPVRDRLVTALSMPDGPAGYVIENVPGAPLHHPVVVCGDTLRLGVRRHRLFESNLPLAGTGCHHDRTTTPVPVYGSYGQRGRRNHVDGETSHHNTAHARAAMGIDWMPWPALTQAIPPAYTWWLGVQLAARDEIRRRLTSPPDQVRCVTPAAAQTSPTDRDTTRQDDDLVGSVTGDATPPAAFRHCRCGNPLPPRPGTGRWPRYCSHACRQAAYRDRHRTREHRQ
jgi:outer membrane biosynthesis protein TonB